MQQISISILMIIRPAGRSVRLLRSTDMPHRHLPLLLLTSLNRRLVRPFTYRALTSLRQSLLNLKRIITHNSLRINPKTNRSNSQSIKRMISSRTHVVNQIRVKITQN